MNRGSAPPYAAKVRSIGDRVRADADTTPELPLEPLEADAEIEPDDKLVVTQSGTW